MMNPETWKELEGYAEKQFRRSHWACFVPFAENPVATTILAFQCGLAAAQDLSVHLLSAREVREGEART